MTLPLKDIHSPHSGKPWAYCGCKRADFDKAHEDANALAAKLGDGWKVRVWENCGWHWQVAKGPCAADDSSFDQGGTIVGPGYGGGYHAEFRSVVNGTQCVTQFFADAAGAEDAIGMVRQDARTFISRIEADLAASYEATGTSSRNGWHQLRCKHCDADMSYDSGD